MLEFTIDLARQAGALLLSGLERQRTIIHKSAFELVTDIDRESESLIVNAILKQFPDHAIIAEEGGGVERPSPFTWLIDPLDGTNNYAHGFPFFSVSLALLQERQPILGVVYDPTRNELFSAERGRGAFCNDKLIHVSNAPTLSESLLSTGFPYDYATIPENNTVEFSRVHTKVQGIRRAGSAALDLAYVAMGRLEAHWELYLKPWDSAAGALLVAEAGGRVSDRFGQAWNPWSDHMIASNGHIHDELVRTLAGDA